MSLGGGDVAFYIGAVDGYSPVLAGIREDTEATASKIASSFTKVDTSAKEMTLSVQRISMGIHTFAMMGSEIVSTAADFGLLDRETSKYVRGFLALVMIVGTAVRIYGFLTYVQTGHNAQLLVGTGATIAHTISTVAHTIATTAAAAATWFLNAGLMAQIGIVTLGVGLLAAGAAVAWALATANNAAAASVRNLNQAFSETPTASARSQNIMRSGDMGLYRAGGGG